MSEEEKVENIKIRLGIAFDDTTHDDTLLSFLEAGKAEILLRAFPYDLTQEEVPAKYEDLQCRIAAYLFGKMGAEGEVSHTENGVTRSYSAAELPIGLLSQVVPVVGVL